MGGKGALGGGVFSPWSKSSSGIRSRGTVAGWMSGTRVPGGATPRSPDGRFSGFVVGALSNSDSNAGEGVGALRGVRPGKPGPLFGDGTTDNLGTGCGAPPPNLGGGVSATESSNTDCGDLGPEPELGGGSFGPKTGVPTRGSETEARCCSASGPDPPAGASLGPDADTGGGALGPDPGTGGSATFGPDPVTGGGALGPDPDAGGGAALGTDPGMGGGATLGPDPGMGGNNFGPEPGCGSFGPEPEAPAGGGLGLDPGGRSLGAESDSGDSGRGVDDESVRAGAGSGFCDGPMGGRRSALIS